MKKTQLIFFTTLAACTILFLSCDEKNINPSVDFDNGVFIVNEGNFNAGDGTISFFDPTTNTTTTDIFGLVNEGLALGDVVQSMTIADEEAYVVVNNDNKVEVVNTITFEALHTIRDVQLPRYFITANGKGYLTEWVSFEDIGRVSVVDLTTHTVIKTITTDLGAENLIAVGNKIFVSNNFTNTISVISTTTDAVVNTIEVSASPGEFVLDAQNKLWVICGGDYQANNSALVQINPVSETVEKTVELTRNVPATLSTDETKNFLYYYSGKSLYKLATAATSEPTEPLFTENAASGFYGMDIDPNTNIIYMGDAKGFAGDGEVYRYNVDGTFINKFSTGRGPNGFVFN